MTMRFWIINLGLFQLSWFLASVYHDEASGLLLLLLLLHFALSPARGQDFYLLMIAVLGCTVDQTLLVADVLTDSKLIPSYLALLWCMLAVSFNHSLFWLTRISMPLVMLIGSVSGSLSYFAALNLDAIHTSLTALSFIVIYALIWACLLPLFVYITKCITDNGEYSHD